MRLSRIFLSSAILMVVTVPAVAMTHARRGPTSQRLFTKHQKASAKPASQHSIDGNRATQIQTALIKAGYLSGEPTGSWDAPTQAAMQKLQGDNGWQTKLIPDSRAIIKLGLGPQQDLVASGQ
jgi:peptidoglycan hydrolase-like protein with peptidoglycan-binding domain